MTDTVKSWIEERRAIHSKGTDVLLRNAYELDREAELWGEDAEAIADAHNMFPRALNALNAVLELHKPVPIYDVEAGDCEHGEDCVGVEFEPSETYCPDHIAYYSCECMMDTSSPDEFPEYPCPTVQAIEGSINE